MIIIVVIFFEILLHFLVKNLKKDFKWIISEDDEIPLFDKKALKKFFEKSFDYDLGWVRKPLTKGIEKAKNKLITFNIDKFGSRKSNLDPSNAKIVSVGDSYTFCRQVEDHETWQNSLSKLTGSSVLNYGVGNYGIDQAILRFNKVHIPQDCEYAVLGFVPETISRIQSYWKHYLEFGNTFAFKPKFEINNNSLRLIPQYVDAFEKYDLLKNNLKHIKSKDRFYKHKFLRHKFRFPYLFYFLKNFRFYSYLFYFLIKGRFIKTTNFHNKLFNRVVKQNLKESQILYKEHKSTELLKKLINYYETICKEKKLKPIILIMPQLHDLKSTRMNHSKFFLNLKTKSTIIDMTNIFKSHKIKKLYIDDFYGGHLSFFANKLVAKAIYSKISIK